MAGRDAAPAGVVRSCTLGRTPEQPRRLLPGRPGPGTVKRESGKMSRGAPTGAVFFFFRACSARPSPRLREGKRDGLTPSPTKAGASIALATHRGRAMRVAVLSVRPRASGGPVIERPVCLVLGPRLRG